MSVLVHRANILTLPGGIWPSILVLALVSIVPFSVLLVGYTIINLVPRESQFLPQHRVPWFTESVIEYKMDYALNSDEYNDVVFLGASATLAGVIISSFEDSTGLRAYNFGTGIDIGPDGHLDLFRAYLESHPKPKLLVYTAFPRDLGDARPSDMELRGRFVDVYGSALKSREASPTLGPKYYFQEGFWFLYESVKSGFAHPYNAPRGGRPSHHELGPLLSQERGYQQYPQSPVLDLGYMDEMDPVRVSEWYQDSFAEMAELARENDIGLILWIMPIPEPRKSLDESPLLLWAEQFQSEFPEVVVEGIPLQEYEHPWWGNPFHLNRQGAEAYTRMVSERVAGLLGQSKAVQP